jgi:microsomal dipeptidase-like Zn-dependent dipeptidase
MVSNPSWPQAGGGFSGASSSDPAKRPEKTDAVARRMIAAGLGMKVPKQTEEQKAYQRSIKEQEKKRRELEKAEQQRLEDEANKAKAAMWDN